MIHWPEEALRRDAFLGGALHLWQPRQGYRAGVDPVLLAASVPAVSGQSVLDLGCGAGAIALCLGSRVPGLKLYGLEKQPAYAELARRNGAEQGFEVHVGDLEDMPASLRALSFHHVVANPPYFERETGTSAPDPMREAALSETTPLAEWIATGAERLRPRGWLHMIIKANRLDDALAGLQRRLGSVVVQPLAPRSGRDAELIILRARKDGRAPLTLKFPVILHQRDRHTQDGEDYTQAVADVLRRGAALDF